MIGKMKRWRAFKNDSNNFYGRKINQRTDILELRKFFDRVEGKGHEVFIGMYSIRFPTYLKLLESDEWL